jgi:DNA-binding NarL/FixJ family response regulator
MDLLLVDDHPVIHELMAMTLRGVVGDAGFHTAESLERALHAARELPRLGLVVLDLGLPGCRHIEALTRFRAIFPEVTVVVMSATTEPACINAALDAGAKGFIPKTSATKVVIAAIRLVLDGGVYIPPEARRGESAARTPRPPEREARERRRLLTARQADVLRLVAKGYRNRRIAQELDVRESTVKQHLHAAFIALGISTRTEAVSMIARESLTLA